MMNIIVYGKPGCKKCDSAKEKLDKMGLPYEFKFLPALVVWHEGWREDESVALLAESTLRDGDMPIIWINGRFYSYSEAMKDIKEARNAAALYKAPGVSGDEVR